MPKAFSLAQQTPPVSVLPPAADAAGRTGAWVGLKKAAKVFLVVHINQGAANTVAVTLQQATSAAGAGAKAGPAVAIYVNLNTGANDALVRQAVDANTFTTDAGLQTKLVIFEVDAAQLDVANGYAYVTLVTGASIAANITQAEAIPTGLRYAGTAPDSLVV
jgi:hypothetical protein